MIVFFISSIYILVLIDLLAVDVTAVGPTAAFLGIQIYFRPIPFLRWSSIIVVE